MSSFKKYPILATIVTISVLIFVAGGTMAALTAGKISKKEKKLRGKIDQLRELATIEPAPLEENKRASAKNYEDLKEDLASYLQTLKRVDGEKDITAGLPNTSFDLLFELKKLQTELTDLAKSLTEEARRKGIDTTVSLDEDEAFSFGYFINDKKDGPKKKEDQVAVYIQKQVISYLVKALFQATEGETQNLELKTVLREPVEEHERPPNGTFIVDPKVTAAVPGIVKTKGFQVSFVSQTRILRKFLNTITSGGMPVVVRSVEVKRVKGEKQAGFADDFDAAFGEEGESAVDNREIVVDTLSTFTVTVEYIEIEEEKEEANEEEDAA